MIANPTILAGFISFVSLPILQPHPSCSWQLTFSDEFNGTSLDAQKWNTQYPSGNGGELQYYAPDAFSLRDSILSIIADRRPMHGYPYSSGIITTQERFSQKYGFFTMRAKLPYGRGFWPAFWMLPVKPDFPTETDIFELHGDEPNVIYMTHHWKKPGAGSQKTQTTYRGPDFSSDFHTFSLLWSKSELSWCIDGEKLFTTNEGIPNEPMFMLINFAVGGKWPGNPDLTTPFPGSMQIDYVRAYGQICHP